MALSAERPQRRIRPFWPAISSPSGLHQAALLFVAAGLIGLVNDFVPGGAGRGHPWSAVLDAVTTAIGALSWLVWDRESLLRPLAYFFPLAALGLIALNDVVGALPEVTIGIWFVLIFVCVGSWFPRGTVLMASPLAAAAYILPLLYGAPRSQDDLASVLLIIPIAVLAGEIVSANSASLRAAHATQQQMLGELTRDTITDPLTSLGNRRLGEALLQSLTPGDALAILDLDRLKAVNDTFGHQSGDDELRNFGLYLLRSLREHDAVARFGGDEFLLIMRKAATDGLEIVERLVAEWRRTDPRATLSAGLAVHVDGVSSESTYADADAALYAAKREGGGRCAVAPRRSIRVPTTQPPAAAPRTWTVEADAS